MSKKNRRQVRKQADTAGAREAQFEAALAAERAKAVQATGVINNAEALALSILTEAGWVVESLDNYRGYQLLVSAPGACEQVVEAKTAMRLVKAVRELGTPDLYPSMVEYIIENLAEEAELEELLAEEAEIADAEKQVGIIKAAHTIYISGRGDFVALAEGENPFGNEGTPIEGNFIQVKELAESLGMVFRGNGGYNNGSGYFEYPPEEDTTPANLFPHPATSGLFRVAPRGVGTDPISGALIAPHGKVFELVNQVMGLSHRQKTIRSAAWERQGWTAQVVTL